MRRLAFRLFFFALAFVFPAHQAGAENLRGTDYNGEDAGYLILSLSEPKSDSLAAKNYSIFLNFRTLNRNTYGFVHQERNDAPDILGLNPPDYRTADETGDVIVRALPPGNYEFNFFSGTNAATTYRARFSLPFTIKAGEATYVGDFRLIVKVHDGFFGRDSAAGYYFTVSDKNGRDIEIARKKKAPEKAAVKPDTAPVTVAVPDFAALKTPLLRADDNVGITSTASARAVSKAQSEQKAGRHAASIKTITPAIEKNDLWPYVQSDAYSIRGLSYLKLNQQDEALADLDKAIALDPYAADAFVNRGLVHLEKGRLTDAIADETKAIDLFPEIIAAYYNRAGMYIVDGQYEKALADIRVLLVVRPDDTDALLLRIAVYRETGKFDQARTELTDAIAKHKFQDFEPRLFRARGFLNFATGKFSDAFEDFDKLIFRRQAIGDDYAGRCLALAALGKAKEGMRDCDKAVELNPRYASAHYSRGYSYFKLEQYDRALEEYNEALRISPRLSQPLYARGIGKLKMGDSAGATEDIEAALKIDPIVDKKMAALGVAP